MSLGVFWSLLNPLILMVVLTFVFTSVFPNQAIPDYPVFFLCGLVPFNFFNVSWINGTISVTSSVSLVKRVPIPKELIPIASVLSNAIHLTIQCALLIAVVLYFGYSANVYWCWLPVLWSLEIVFITGLVLLTSALDVYLRDTRYIVDSACTVLFWLVPIVYTLAIVPPEYVWVYEYNPVAALILGLRRILIDGASPNGDSGLVYKLAISASITFLCGLGIFSRLKKGFFDHL